MLRFILPAQEDFFDLFQKIADQLLDVARHFQILAQNLDNIDYTLPLINAHDERAHLIVKDTFEKLHKIFITPFDRYDTHRFVKKLDATVAAIQRTATRIALYKLTSLPDELKEMVSFSLNSAELIQQATQQLNSLKNASQILEKCDQISLLEDEADKLLLSGLSKLFEEEQDLRQVFKVKEIYEHTKSIHNGYQVISNIIRDIVLEYS